MDKIYNIKTNEKLSVEYFIDYSAGLKPGSWAHWFLNLRDEALETKHVDTFLNPDMHEWRVQYKVFFPKNTLGMYWDNLAYIIQDKMYEDLDESIMTQVTGSGVSCTVTFILEYCD